MSPVFRRFAASFFWIVLMAGCGPDPGFEPLANPAGPGAGEPNLFAAPDGALWMSWIEPLGEAHALRLAALRNDAWGPVATVAESGEMFVNWADFPSMAVGADGTLLAHWLLRRGGGRYAYDVVVSRSADDGRTWDAAEVLHDDGVPGEHGFVSLVPEPDGSFTAVWLDGRFTVGESPRMTLRAANIGNDGTVTDRAELDPRICDCCQTSAAMIGGSLVAVYRDRSDDEVRDIWATRRDASGWHDPVAVAHDDWQIPGCPVNGPSITARDGIGAVAWFALVDGAPEVKLAFTEDEGVTFSAPHLIERSTEPATLGRVDLEWVNDHTVVVTWMSAVEEQAEIRYRTVSRNGKLGPTRSMARTSAARSSGFPRLAVVGSWLVAAWTAPGEPAEIHTARAPLRAFVGD